MTLPLIVPIVEGHGEVEALPHLVRRIYGRYAPAVQAEVNPPLRVKVGSFLADVSFFRSRVEFAANKAAQRKGLVLILLDCEDQCPGVLGPELLHRSSAVRRDVPCTVVLAHREYETWFVAAAESLAGLAGLPSDVAAPANPESIRGAKEWLSARMPRPYDPIRDQLKFTSHFSLDAARVIPSFDRLVAKLLSFGTAP